jgi:hypothetical protein
MPIAMLLFIHLTGKGNKMSYMSDLDVQAQDAVRHMVNTKDDSWWRELCTKYPEIFDFTDWEDYEETMAGNL